MGTSVVITGTNLLGVTSVKFNGVTATFVGTITATSVTATVPTGATTGPIVVVTTASGYGDEHDRLHGDDGAGCPLGLGVRVPAEQSSLRHR